MYALSLLSGIMNRTAYTSGSYKRPNRDRSRSHLQLRDGVFIPVCGGYNQPTDGLGPVFYCGVHPETELGCDECRKTERYSETLKELDKSHPRRHGNIK